MVMAPELGATLSIGVRVGLMTVGHRSMGALRLTVNLRSGSSEALVEISPLREVCCGVHHHFF